MPGEEIERRDEPDEESNGYLGGRDSYDRGHTGLWQHFARLAPVRAHSHADQDAETHLHGDLDADGHANPERHADADLYTLAHEYADRDAFAANAHLDTATTYRHPVAYRYAGAADQHTQAHDQTPAQANSDADSKTTANNAAPAAVCLVGGRQQHHAKLWFNPAVRFRARPQ